jgi:PAS domain S-box-containing protein
MAAALAQKERELRVYAETLEQRIQERTKELQESNAQLSRAQEIAHLGSWELDLVNNQLTWSDEVYRIFGLQPQEFDATFEAFLEAVHPDDRATVNNTYASSIRDGKDSYEIQHRVVRRSSGEIRIVHEKCEHFRNQDGQIIRSVGMVHDVTERKQTEKAFQESQQLLNNIVDSSSSLIYVTDKDGRWSISRGPDWKNAGSYSSQGDCRRTPGERLDRTDGESTSLDRGEKHRTGWAALLLDGQNATPGSEWRGLCCSRYFHRHHGTQAG